MTSFDGKPRWRCLCVRCHEYFSGPRPFSIHLGECDKLIDIEFILEYLQVDRGDGCWVMHEPRGTRLIPKFGIAPRRVMHVHEVIATAAHGERPDGLMLCHSCDNRNCIRPTHLYWGTAQENVRDAWRNQRRSMSKEQLRAMSEGRKSSDKNKEHMIRHNQELGLKQRGENHWTRKDPEAMRRWVEAITEGRRAKARARVATVEGGGANDD